MTRHIVLLGDVHLADKGPVSRTDDWAAACFAKLAWVETLARDHGAPILCTGDLFHKPVVAMSVLVRLLEWLPRTSFVTVAGNHDLFYERPDTLPRTALGVVASVGALAPLLSVLTPTNRLMWTPGLTVEGLAYPVQPDDYRQVSARGDQPLVALVHGFASETGSNVYGVECQSYAQIAEWAPGPDVFVFGHDHSYGGVVTIGRQHFVRPGALMRGSTARDDVRRVPSVVLASYEEETQSWAFERREVPCRPVQEVFDLDRKQQVDRERVEVERFIGQLRTDLLGPGRVDYRVRVAALDMPDRVRTAVLAYIEKAERDGSVQL